MANLKQMVFQTSVFTGTTPKEGGKLAQLISTSLAGVGAVAKAYKSQNEEEDKLLYSDLKLDMSKKMREFDYDNKTGFEQSQFLDDITSEKKYEFNNQLYQNNYDLLVEKFRAGVNTKLKNEAIATIENEVIPDLANANNTLTMEDIEMYTQSFKDAGVQRPKQRMLKAISANIYSQLAEEQYENMTAKEIRAKFPILNEIQDPEYKRMINDKIDVLDAQYQKKLYVNDVNGFSSNMSSTLESKVKTASVLAKKYKKTYLEVHKDITDSQNAYLDLFVTSGNPVQMQEGVNIAIQNNREIKPIENLLDNMEGQIMSNPDSAFATYQATKTAFSSGYPIRSKNLDEFIVMQDLASDFGLEINTPDRLQEAYGLLKMKKENKSAIMTEKELNEHSKLNGWFDRWDVSDSQMMFIRKKAKTLSAFLPHDKAVDRALEMSKVSFKGSDGFKADWSGTKLIKTDEDVEIFKQHTEERWGKLDNVSIFKTTNGFIFSGTGKGGVEIHQPMSNIEVDEMFRKQKNKAMPKEEKTKIYETEIEHKRLTDTDSKTSSEAWSILKDVIDSVIDKVDTVYEDTLEAFRVWDEKVDEEMKKELPMATGSERAKIKEMIYGVK